MTHVAKLIGACLYLSVPLFDPSKSSSIVKSFNGIIHIHYRYASGDTLSGAEPVGRRDCASPFYQRRSIAFDPAAIRLEPVVALLNSLIATATYLTTGDLLL